MKKSLFIFAVFFSLSAGPLAGQSNELELSFSASKSLRGFETLFNYQLQPFRNSLLRISGRNDSEQRLSFYQLSRQSLLALDLDLDGKRLRHTISSGFEYLYDSSDLDQELHPYNNKTGNLGYRLSYSPWDSLNVELGGKGFIRREEDRYQSGNLLTSDGYDLSGRASVGFGLLQSDAGINGEFALHDLDWERYRSANLNAYLNYQGSQVVYSNLLAIGKRADDLYILAEDNTTGRGYYSLYDKQTRTSLAYSGLFEYRPSEALSFVLGENYSERKTSLRENAVRSNSDQANQITLKSEYQPWARILWSVEAGHNYAVKYYDFTNNTRLTENRSLGTHAAWQYAWGDTLSLGASIDLQRTVFPDDGHRWDNDLRNIRISLGNVHYWRDRIKLSNQIYTLLADDIYIKGILSNNNKHTSSLIYKPSCGILIGDRLLFNQDYQIRADYTDYMYDTANKAFYRQLSVAYDLVFDSFPYIARSQDERWMLIPFRKPASTAYLADLKFSYERNEYADYTGSVYQIDFKNTRYTTSVTFKQDIRYLYYIIQPKYSWGTWREYSLLFGLAWKISDLSLLELSVNPNGDNLHDLDWRTAINLRAEF